MPIGDLITTDTQVELRGLLLGDGTDYPITGPIEGLGNLDLRSVDLDRPLDHGAFAGRQFYGKRSLRIPYAILGDDPDDAMAKLEVLGAACRVVIPTLDEADVIGIVFRIGGRRLTAFGKPGRNAVDVLHLPKGSTIRGILEFVATDPRLYGDEELANASPGAVTGGLELPHGFPHGFGSATPGTAQVTNDGNFPTYPVATVTVGPGGINTFTLEKVSTGETMTMTLALSEGDVVELDFGERSAVLNGTASRSNFIDRPGSTWFGLDPGTTAINFTADGDAELELAWRDAFVFG
jgi:hypothetical protein